MDNNDKKPIKRFRRGGVDAAIWKKQIDGRLAFSVQVNKRYRKEPGEFQTTQVFLGGDLIRLARVAELADAWIHEQLESARGDHA